MTRILVILLATLLLGGPAAAEGYLERIVREQCTAARDAGDAGKARYERWMDATARDAGAEYRAARDEVMRIADPWVRATETLAKLDLELANLDHFRYMAQTAGKLELRFSTLGIQIYELTERQGKTSDPQERRDLEAKIEALRVQADKAGRELSELWHSPAWFQTARSLGVLGPTGHLAGIEDIARAVTRRRAELRPQRDQEAARKAKLEAEFKPASQRYDDARAILAAIREIDSRVRRCLGPKPVEANRLDAYWMLRVFSQKKPATGSDEEEPVIGYCTSGRIVIDFDDAGNALSGRMTTDCVVTRAPNRVVQCPLPSHEVLTQELRGLRADLDQGRISMQFPDAGQYTPGAMVGAFERIGSAPPTATRAAA